MALRKVRRGLVVVLFSLFLLLPACQIGGQRLYQTTFLDLFHTVTTVKLYADSQEQFDAYAKAVYDDLREYHRLYDIYDSYGGMSNLCTVNQQAGQHPVTVDSRILDLLSYGKDVYRQTDGLVNMAYGRVLSLWHACRERALEGGEAGLPEAEALAEAAQHTSIEAVVLDKENRTVQFTDPLVQLDVGAFAKGYAVEQVCRRMGQEGRNGLVIAGGNVRAVGTKADGTPWHVGVENPWDHGTYSAVVEVMGGSVVTSGDDQRFYEVNGQRYGHILHPATGYPATYMRSVTVITADSGRADALSTYLFLMPPEEGKERVDTMEGVEALWILPDGTIQYSNRMEAYLVKEGAV